jgi:hypothetical protein
LFICHGVGDDEKVLQDWHLVGFRQSGLELSVGVDQALDLVQRVNDEHVHQVLAGTVQPVVEGLKS